jgi:hypothetical protein
MLDYFLSKLPKDDKDTRSMVEQAFGIADNLRGKVAEIRADADLSLQGKATRVKAIALGSCKDHFDQIRSAVAKLNTDVVNLRKSFEPKADPADKTGADDRREIRQRVFDLPPPERFRLAMQDQAVALAMLLAPHAVAHGLSAEQYDLVKKNYIETTHGEQIRGLDQRAEVIEVLNSAIATATRQFVLATDLPKAEIDVDHVAYANAVASFNEALQKLDRGADDYQDSKLKLAENFRKQAEDHIDTLEAAA